MKTFSANAASEILEKDRRTIVRALRRTKPDAYEGRHPRWRMKVILDSLAAHERSVTTQSAMNESPRRRTPFDDEFDAACQANFDAQERLKAEPNLQLRREMAKRIAPPLINRVEHLLRQQGEAAGQDEVLWGCYIDRMFHLMLIGYQSACKWKFYEETREALDI